MNIEAPGTFNIKFNDDLSADRVFKKVFSAGNFTIQFGVLVFVAAGLDAGSFATDTQLCEIEIGKGFCDLSVSFPHAGQTVSAVYGVFDRKD